MPNIHLESDAPKVLIIDDELLLLETLQALLENEGFKVILATDGMEGLDLLRTGSCPDLILLDLMMPKLSGFEFLKQIKSEPLKISNIPIVVLSAAEPRLFNHPNLQYAKHLLTKPFDADHLLQLLRSVLSEQKLAAS